MSEIPPDAQCFRIPKEERACKIDGGKLYRLSRGTFSYPGTDPIEGDCWISIGDRPEDAPFREAWERLRQQNEWHNFKETILDGLLWLVKVECPCAGELMALHGCARCDGTGQIPELWREDDPRLEMSFDEVDLFGEPGQLDEAKVAIMLRRHSLAGLRWIWQENGEPRRKDVRW